MDHSLPILGITMGDVCGIGPEITAKALLHKDVYEICRPLVVGSAAVLRRAAERMSLPLAINAVGEVGQARFAYGTVDVLDQDTVDLNDAAYGKVTTTGGRAAFEAVTEAIRLAMADEIDGTVTGPLNKEAMNLAGHHYSGHTEIYAAFTGTKDYTMMLAEGSLRVVHVSTHVSLREACDRVKKERVYKVIRIANEACRSLGIDSPKIAVAGLNPHSGENGLFGDEEQREILPAIEQARAEGIHVDGPLPPDTVFSKARGGLYDIVVAMYHDQGHIALKMVGFVLDRETQKWKSVSGVNITLGLPIVRSSVDHGTAFDQAGKGTATEGSLISAIEYGAKLAVRRLEQKGRR